MPGADARHARPHADRAGADLAAELGDKGLSRAIGQALGHNPFAPVMPCHRVLAANGKPGGFWSARRRDGKAQDAEIEGARPPSDTETF